ncbi:hypothetical protein FJT64_018560 [Amphibalanus amphitrite]|uniref:Sushi domain-containing protein n=1 Tax=Amphibalanus amphitrite TaxID=1232801 RepID=A0A6A4WTH3_AMPAM|nr:hypothetical protein FJT64_018560 [Amphibalanus amphitrite]
MRYDLGTIVLAALIATANGKCLAAPLRVVGRLLKVDSRLGIAGPDAPAARNGTAPWGACDTNTLFFGDVNLSTVPPYQLTVVSAVGTYVLEPNNVSLVAYRHIGRPDQFLLKEPSAAAQKNWVVATLPDNKKPAEVQHAYEAWPEAGNILARGEFEGEPWAPGAGAWEVNDCDEGRTPLPSLSLSCVAPTFGQCATERWRVVEPDSTFVDVLTPAGEGSPDFDSVSPNCEAVRECRVPKRVANAQLLFTSDLSPQGKAFYRCDVGYYVKNGTGSAGNRTTNSAFATC